MSAPSSWSRALAPWLATCGLVLLSAGCFEPVDQVWLGDSGTSPFSDGGTQPDDGGADGSTGTDGGRADGGARDGGPAANCSGYAQGITVETSAEPNRARKWGRCSDAHGPVLPHKTAAELKKLMTGRWAYCAGAGKLGPAQAAGLELTPGGKLYVLQRDDQGAYSRMNGFMTEADVCIWSYDSNPDSYQVDVNWVNGGLTILHPKFTDPPLKMNAFHMGGDAIYVAIP